MGSEALDVVKRWRAANFERAAVEDVLAEDVEWVVPRGGGVTTLRGIDAVLEWYQSGGIADEGPPEAVRDVEVDVSEERGELEDFGGGRVGSVNRVVYTSKGSGEVAEVQTARLVYTVRDGKIVRYEVEDVADPEAAGATAD